MKSFMHLSIGISTLAAGCAAVWFSFVVWQGNTNARLVEIGVGVLRADPKKDESARIAREWAIDLIEANSGSAKFSGEARRKLLDNALNYQPTYSYGPDGYDYTPESSHDDGWPPKGGSRKKKSN